VAANGLVYFLNDDGVMHVVKAGPKFELIARNELGEKSYASPALSEGQIFLRSFKHSQMVASMPAGGFLFLDVHPFQRTFPVAAS
jgi:hypothetical protein